ncbi:MAG: sigma-70 family RNA polymerase sigma factor [Patescibacteria group bacterium]|jgi:RNA polymerase sigma-70 factor (ECF subfamily)
MAGISDKDIIRKIRDGEIDSYSHIVKKYTTSIYRYIKAKLFDKEEVDDLVQNVFISFYKAIEKFDVKRPVKPYLFQIVQNELKMYYRSKKPTVQLSEDIYLIHDRKIDIIDDSYLNYLSIDERKIFSHLKKGYSYKEISKLIKKPINTIKSIVRRGRLKLKKTI